MNKAISIVLLFLLTACDSRIDGKHSDGGVVTYDFKAGGRVTMTVLGDASDYAYEQPDVNHVNVIGPKGSLSFTHQADGTWLGPMDVKLTKVVR